MITCRTFLLCMGLLGGVLNPAFGMLADNIKFDDTRTYGDVIVKNVKQGDFRVYHAELGSDIDSNFDTVLKRILAFDERCNNDYKEKRKYMDKTKDCAQHNDNLVESFIIRDLKKGHAVLDNETQRFLILRNIYNRETFQYYDLVTVQQSRNQQGKRKAVVIYRMLSDAEAQTYIEHPVKKNNVFNVIEGVYTIEELGDPKTSVKMSYTSQTDHWMLTSGFAAGIVSKNVAKGTSATLKSLNFALPFETRKNDGSGAQIKKL